jgi:hypothetical protein
LKFQQIQHSIELIPNAPTHSPDQTMRHAFAATLAGIATLTAASAFAADSTHSVKNAKGGTYEEAWWQTLAYCAGQTNVLAEWAKGEGKPEAAALANGSNLLWSLSIKRLVTERGISPEAAQEVAMPTVRDAAALQKQGISIYAATGQMEDEFKKKVDRCNSEVHDYVAAFPNDLAQ